MSVKQLEGIYLFKKDGKGLPPGLLQGYRSVRPGVRLPFKIKNKYLGVTHRRMKQRLYVDETTGINYVFQGDTRYSNSEADSIDSQEELNSLIESLTSHPIQNKNKKHPKSDEEIFPSFKYGKDWTIESNNFGEYVVFNGKEDFIDSVERQLAIERKINYEDSKPSKRKTKKENIQFDHYIKFKKGTYSEKRLIHLFQEIFNKVHSTESISVDEEEKEKIILNLQESHIKQTELNESLKEQKKKETKLKLELEKTKAKGKDTVQHQKRIEELEGELEQVQQISDEDSAKNKELEKRIKKLNEQKNSKENLQLDKKTRETTYNKRKQLETIIGTGFKYIYFLGKSWDILVEVSDFGEIFETLGHLQGDKRSLKSKKITQVEGTRKVWFEIVRQINIGRSNDEKARVYFRDNPNGTKRKTAVLIGLKRNQQKDFKYLSKFTNHDGVNIN